MRFIRESMPCIASSSLECYTWSKRNNKGMHGMNSIFSEQGVLGLGMTLPESWLGIEALYWQKGIRLAALVIGAYLVTRVVMALIDRYQRLADDTQERTLLVPGGKRIATVATILRNALFVVMVATTLLMVLSELGINITPLLAGAGAAAIAAGFGAQSLLKDLFYGFITLLENPFGLGDTVQVGETVGQVEGMTLRVLKLRDKEGRLHIIPNGEATKVVVYPHKHT